MLPGRLQRPGNLDTGPWAKDCLGFATELCRIVQHVSKPGFHDSAGFASWDPLNVVSPFRPMGSNFLAAHRQGLHQALRSAASSLVAAPGLVVPTLALILAAPLLGSPALASSLAAWAAYDARVRAACRAATTLVGAVERGDRLDLPGPALSVFLLEGRYRQPHMQGQRGLELCVYEQASSRAVVVGADRLYGPGASSPSGSRPADREPLMAPARP